MNIRIMNTHTMLVVLFLPLYITSINGYEHKARSTQSRSAYLSSLVISGAVGAITGASIRYAEQRWITNESPAELFLIFLGWAIESEVRNDIIAILQKNMDEYSLSHKKALMFKIAWLTSWLFYLT